MKNNLKFYMILLSLIVLLCLLLVAYNSFNGGDIRIWIILSLSSITLLLLGIASNNYKK